VSTGEKNHREEVSRNGAEVLSMVMARNNQSKTSISASIQSIGMKKGVKNIENNQNSEHQL
jgi:hypothetical protein